MSSKQAHFRFLCTFVYVYFFAQAMSMSLLALWLRSTLQLSGAETGIVFAANFIAAMCSQPVYGYVSDKIGMRKHVLWAVGVMCMLSGLFLVYVYGPLLKTHILAGAALGGIYLGITFIAGSYAIESYVDRIGRAYGFEYSRVRLWGSLGFASAAFLTGRLYNVDPHINFMLASCAGLLLVLMLAFWRLPEHAVSSATGEKLRLADALALLRDKAFWRFMVFVLTVTNIYLVYDQQFPSYFASQFPDKATGAAMFGYLNSLQIFVEAAGLFVSPLLVRRIGAKYGLLLAGSIMIVRIAGSGLAVGPVSISAMKMLHSVELPILVVSVFRYIAYHFDNRLASTVYMVGVSFGHSLGLALLSPLVGKAYDLIGFNHTYLLLAAIGAVFLLLSVFALSPTPAETTKATP
ncbi:MULTISPECIES: oligosaccharide MFS transporter [unclassified Duganella]|jgi:oligosaccharide:H+ symporter|uniref:oligosaccharide MFS transporter n=1 Tax=unclassified Duganella TaxID=2636909 RepID=UPI000882FB84|nr:MULTISPECIES: oligosaccharide MFS transporter [unclassified Duganella]SDF66168.1 MFS transporter, OHS family, lactose permease [Duganella sp. OV458]SDI62764.1 MFS transporter, OHS family, lactose permease [Duganella sp. OV510]